MQEKLLFQMSMYLICTWFVSVSEISALSAQHNLPADTVKSVHLQDVEVFAQPRVSTAKQATPLQIIDHKNIKRLGMQELSEAVRLFSGVTVKDYGGMGGLKTVSIRSLGAQHTAVGYDGVAISDAQSGQVDISRFTLDNVEMVSLSVGLNEDIFQTARLYASAGALQIKTQKPRFEDNKYSLLTAKFKSGSFGLLNPVLSFSQKLGERWSATIHADYMKANGKYPYTLVNGTLKTSEKRINSDIETMRLEGNVYGDFGAGGGNLDVKLYAFNSKRGLPGSVNFYNRTANERLWNDNSFFQARYKNQFNEKIAVQAVAKYAYNYSRYKDVNDKYAAGYQEDRNTQHEYYGSAGVLVTPLKSLSASFTSDYAYTQLHNNFLKGVQPRRNTSLTVLAMQYKMSAFTASGSLLGTYISDETVNGDRSGDSKHLSPAIAVSWQPFTANALRIRASYKDIFRAPTFTDLYYLRVGNTNLKPEKAKQWNMGMTWSGEIGSIVRYLNFSADVYYNKVEDKIVALPTLYIWKMMNMGEVEIKGADVTVSAEIPLTDKISTTILCNYTWQQAIDITNPDAKNYKNQIPYTPRHAGNSAVTIETPWISCSYLLTAVGERFALPQNTKANKVNGYVEQTASLNRTFMLKNIPLRIQGEVMNFMNTQYDVIQYYPMPGRSWRFSLVFNF